MQTHTQPSLKSLLSIIVALSGAHACGQTPADEVETVTSALINSPCGFVPTDSVCVCTGAQGTGQCASLTTDLRFFGNLSTYSSGVFNDSISDFWVGPDAKARICSNAGMTGNCQEISGTVPNGYRDSDVGGCGLCPCGAPGCDPLCCEFDQASSIRVTNKGDNCQSPGLGHVAFFTDINYGGDCVVLFRQTGVHLGWPDPNANATNATQGGGFGLPDNSISSVKIGVVGQGHDFSIYDGVNYTGAQFPGGGAVSVPDMRTYSFNDRTSSILTAD